MVHQLSHDLSAIGSWPMQPAVATGADRVGKDSRSIIRELEADGWYFVGATGSHFHFKHRMKPGKVTVPHPRRDLHPKTVRSIYRQAGLNERR